MNALDAVSWKVKAAAAAAVVVIIAGAGAGIAWWATSTSYKSDIAELNRQHAEEREAWGREKIAITTAAQQATADAYNRTRQAQDAAAAADKKAQEALANAQRENDSLRADVAAGIKRVRILSANLATANIASQHATGGSAGACSVGDGEGAELSAEAGQRVLDIRAGIIRREAKINYLQDYVQNVVKGCKR